MDKIITGSKYKNYLDEKNWEPEFRYQLLNRMLYDCIYFLGYGNFCCKFLWAGNAADQIGYMKALWESFPEDGKPEWLTMEQIIEYEQKMVNAHSMKGGTLI